MDNQVLDLFRKDINIQKREITRLTKAIRLMLKSNCGYNDNMIDHEIRLIRAGKSKFQWGMTYVETSNEIQKQNI